MSDQMRSHIIVGAVPPATEAGRLWHEEWHSEEGGGPEKCGTAGCGFLGRILAVEAETVTAARDALLRISDICKPNGIDGLSGRPTWDSGAGGNKERIWRIAEEAIVALGDSDAKD